MNLLKRMCTCPSLDVESCKGLEPKTFGVTIMWHRDVYCAGREDFSGEEPMKRKVTKSVFAYIPGI